MGDSVHCLRPGFLSSLQWPSFLSPSLSKPRLTCERGYEDVPGILQQGPRGRLPSQQLPNPAWLAPEDLQKPFTPQSRVEDGLKHYAAHHAEEPIPRPLLRELLEEALAVERLSAGVNLLGTRLAAARAGGHLVVASACGRIGEELSVAILAAAGESSGDLQCVARMRAACAGMPIQQLCFNCPTGPDQGPLLLATGAHSWLCFHEVIVWTQQPGLAPQECSSSNGKWELRAVGALQSRQRLAHMAWNRCLPSLAAFVLEDGTLCTVDTQPVAARQAVQKEGAKIGLLGGTFPVLRPAMLTEPLEAPPGARRSRLLCEWTAHPTGLLLAAGASLWRYDLRRPNQTPPPRVLHRLAPGDAFVALACPAGPVSCGAYSGDKHHRHSTFPHLLAASTLCEVVLLDLRRPEQALLKWAHELAVKDLRWPSIEDDSSGAAADAAGQSRDPPALLALLPALPTMPDVPDTSPGRDPVRNAPGVDSEPHRRFSQATAEKDRGAAPSPHAGPVGAQRVEQPEGTPPALELRAEDVLQSQYGSSSQLPSEVAPPNAGERSLGGGVGVGGTQASQTPLPDLAVQASQAQQLPPATAGVCAAAAAAAAATGTITQEPPGSSSCLQGFIAAGSLGSGDVISFAFSLAAPEVRLCRTAVASSSHAQASGDPADVLSSRVSVQRLSPGAGRDAGITQAAGDDGPSASRSRGVAGAEGAVGFTWAPLGLCSARSLGLPRRVCWPLAQLSREPPGLQGMREPEQARELEAALRNAPDLAGMALLPAPPLVPSAAAGDNGKQQSQSPKDKGSMLLLRLGFLGDVAVDRIRTPWEMSQQRSKPEEASATAAASLGSLLGPRHAGAVPEYTIRCLPEEEARSAERGFGLHAPPAHSRRGKSADLSDDLICDVSVHRSVAAKSVRCWAAASSSGGGAGMEEGAVEACPKQDSPEVQRLMQRLLSEMQAQTQVPLTMWEVCQELPQVSREIGPLRPVPGASARHACSSWPAQAGSEEDAFALQRRVRSVRRGAPAAPSAGGTDGGGGPPQPQPRLQLWQKARGTDPANIAGERLLSAYREARREDTAGLPGRVASTTAALASLLAAPEAADAPTSSSAMPAIGVAAGAAFALRRDLRLPPAGIGIRNSARHADVDAPAAEGVGLGSQVTTASQPPGAQAAPPIVPGPLVQRWSGCGSVLVPLQPARRMFGGAAAASPAQEPRLVMAPAEAGDAGALERLTALEDKWFTADGEQKLIRSAAEQSASAPEQAPASQAMQAAPCPRPEQQQEAPHQAQRKSQAGPDQASPPSRPKRPAKKRRTVLQEGFS